jgi:aryl carrier-like protein
MRYLTEWKKKHQHWKFVVIVNKYDEQVFRFTTYEEAEKRADEFVLLGAGLDNVHIMKWEDYNAD